MNMDKRPEPLKKKKKKKERKKAINAHNIADLRSTRSKKKS